MGLSVRQGYEFRDDTASGPASPVSAARLLTHLEAARESLHGGLDRIEALARQRLASLPPPDDETGERLREVEQARAHFKAEADLWEQTRRSQIAELEHDRRLLAEAWERLERSQVEGHGSSRAATTGGAPVVLVDPQPARRATATTEGESEVSQAILRQFEALRRDVRRSATERRPG